MAHRADIIQVHRDFPVEDTTEVKVDPICGRKLMSKEARSILFGSSETYYFCGPACREKFLNQKKRSRQAA